jgi:hypothetical protein
MGEIRRRPSRAAAMSDSDDAVKSKSVDRSEINVFSRQCHRRREPRAASADESRDDVNESAWNVEPRIYWA